MAIRVTPEEVTEIIEVDEDFSLTPFIIVASQLVDEHLEGSTKPDGTLWHTDERLKEIERWLSAHFYAASLDPRVSSEQVSSIITWFQSKVDLGFNVTHYGQQAMRLDSSGKLAWLDMMAKKGKLRRGVRATWMGKEVS